MEIKGAEGHVWIEKTGSWAITGTSQEGEQGRMVQTGWRRRGMRKGKRDEGGRETVCDGAYWASTCSSASNGFHDNSSSPDYE